MTGVTTINMKPTEGHIQKTETKAETSSTQGRVVLIVATVVLSIIAIAGITLAAVYFGTHLTHKAIKEGKVLVHTADMPPVEEIITVREAEVEVKAPGRFTVLNDYRKFLSVFKVEGEDGSRCYVSALNRTIVGTPEEMENSILAKERFVSPDEAPVEYVSTGRVVDPATLSEQAKIMCGGAQIEWISQLQDGAALREKRCAGPGKGKKGKGDKITIRITIVIVVHKCKAKH